MKETKHLAPKPITWVFLFLFLNQLLSHHLSHQTRMCSGQSWAERPHSSLWEGPARWLLWPLASFLSLHFCRHCAMDREREDR